MADKERKHLKETSRSRKRDRQLAERMKKRLALKKSGGKSKKTLKRRKKSVAETRKIIRKSKSKGKIPEAAEKMIKQLGKTPKVASKSLYEQYMAAKKKKKK